MPPHKRSFDEFAEPLPPFKWGRPFLHNNKPDGTPRSHSEPIKPNQVPFYDHATKRVPGQNATVKNCLLHGIDPEKYISRLTNKIHPIFHTICRCKYTKDHLCYSTKAHLDLVTRIPPAQVPEIASPAPSDNFVVRTIMQLATRLITSDGGLRFISGLMECGSVNKKPSTGFYITPKELSSISGSSLVWKVHRVARLSLPTRGNGMDLARHGPLTYTWTWKKIKGYDFGAPNYDQRTVGDLGRTIIRSAASLCHELAHAMAWFEVQTKDEPRFNDEPFAEAGHAFENYLLGGTMDSGQTLNGLWLRQWPVVGRLTGYTRNVFHKPIYESGVWAVPGDRWVDARVYTPLLSDHFWDNETVASGGRRCKPLKKTWLRPYHETPTTAQEYAHFASGYLEAPLRGNQAKRRRLAGTRGQCPRWVDTRKETRSTSQKSRRVQCVRRKGKKVKRKQEFHERELLRLNQAWVDLLRHVPRNAF